MSKLNITEYRDHGRGLSGHPLAVGEEGSLVIQELAFTTSAVPSALFNADTKLIRVISDVDARILFGISPTADVDSTLIPAGGVEYFGIKKGLRLSVIEEL